MRRVLPILVLAASLALAACGDDTTTVTETETTGATETTETTAAEGPSGELTSSGVGEVTQGTTTQEAREHFGRPARAQTGPGCELSGQSERAIAWTYNLDGGTLVLTFDAANGELGYYRTTSPELATNLGDRVGSPFSSLEENWGNSLEPVPIGSGPTKKAGFWWVKDGPESELLFDIRGGRIAGISGGHIEICE